MKKSLLILVIVLLSIIELSAQNNVVSAGNSASTSDGSVSYSLGYLATKSSNQENTKISEGLQHAYEIYDITNILELADNFNISIYPNPSVNELFLEVDDLELKNISYELFDVNGKKIYEEIVLAGRSSIDMAELSSGNYLLVINQKQNILKSFKIVKK